jgi:hypothetical protein
VIGQKHYIIMRPGDRPQFWRSRRNQYSGDGWTHDMRRCKSYHSADNALRSARQLEIEAGSTLEVVEIETVVSRVCYRVETLELIGV